MGGSFWQGVKLGAISGAIQGAIQGVATSEQFQNWIAGNGFMSNADAEAQQARLADMKELLPQAKNADETMESVTSATQASESGVAADIAGELNQNIKAFPTGITQKVFLFKEFVGNDNLSSISDMIGVAQNLPTFSFVQTIYHYAFYDQWALFDVTGSSPIQIYGTEYWQFSRYYSRTILEVGGLPSNIRCD